MAEVKEEMRRIVEDILNPPPNERDNILFNRNYDLAFSELLPIVVEAPLVYFELLRELCQEDKIPLNSGNSSYFPLAVAVQGIPVWRAKQLAEMLLWPQIYARNDFSVLSSLVEKLEKIGDSCATANLWQCMKLVKECSFATDADGRMYPGVKRMVRKIQLAIISCGSRGFEPNSGDFLWQSAGQ